MPLYFLRRPLRRPFGRRPWRGASPPSAPAGDCSPRCGWHLGDGGEAPCGGEDPRLGGEQDRESWLSTWPPSGALWTRQRGKGPFPLPPSLYTPVPLPPRPALPL